MQTEEQSHKTEVKRLSNAFLVNPDDLIIIGLDTKDDSGHVLYDKRAFLPVDEALVKIMMSEGFCFGAIEVTKIDGKYLVVDGRQRVKAAREARKRMVANGLQPLNVRCFIEHGQKETMFKIMIMANHFKKEVDPLSRAELIVSYKQRYGANNRDAAQLFGLSSERIRQTLKLLDLVEAVKDAIRDGRISSNKAEAIAELDAEEQERALAKAIAREESAEEIRAQARNKKNGKNEIARPGIRRIREVLENEHLSPHAKHALRWVLGEEDSAQP